MTQNSTMHVYGSLQRLAIFPDSYFAKFVLAALPGICAPLIGVALYVALQPERTVDAPSLIIVLTVATVAGAGFASLMMRTLLTPIDRVAAAVRGYLNERRLPDLPVHFQDTAGRLMADAQYLIGELDQTIRQLEQISLTDYHTGLHNRRAAEERLAQEIARTRRTDEEFVTVFVGLNELRAINRSYGHDVGDECIRRAAAILSAAVRKGDWCARWLGGKFVMLLYGPAGDNDAILERIVEEFEREPLITSGGLALPLSVSCGATKYHAGDKVDTLIKRADAAMRGGKAEGTVISWLKKDP